MIGNKDDMRIFQDVEQLPEISDYPTYDGTLQLHTFLIDMEDKVAVEQITSTLDISLKSSPTRCWATNKGNLSSWDEVKLSI
jgi:hypothetical protein